MAFEAKHSRRTSSPTGEHNFQSSTFDFFAYFDPILRTHLRYAYDRRKRWDYTGDKPQGLSLVIATLPIANAKDLVGAVQAAIDSPASESDGQVLRRRDEEDKEKVNKELDEFDQGFEGTWKGVLRSTIATTSALSNYARTRIKE